MPKEYRFVLITIVLTFFTHCSSYDTITQNQSFKDDGHVLVSSGNNNFAFGFFSPGNSLNRYVGIWYNKIPEHTVVWVANRDNPINGANGVLSIGDSGNLVLRDTSSNSLLWSANVSGKSTPGSYFVQLMDTGNLVLYEAEGSTSVISWQSFDHPTNTFLPHMKIGVNLTSGLVWGLASWRSRDDPGTGDFRYFIELKGSPQMILHKKPETIIWRTGPWNGIGYSGVPDMRIKAFVIVDYIEDDEEVALSFSVDNTSILSRITLNESGTLEILRWQEDHLSWLSFWSAPRDQCDYYDYCGSFSICDPHNTGDFVCQCLPGYEPKVKSEWEVRDGTNGCTRKLGEQTCGNSSSANFGFIKVTSVKVPDTRNAVVNKILGLKECEDLCSRNCSCTAYTNANISDGGSGCITWYGDLNDTKQFPNHGQDVYVRVSASESAQYLKNSKRTDSKKLIIILLPSTTGFLLFAFAFCLVFRKLKGQPKKSLSIERDPVSPYGFTSREEEIDEAGVIPVFDLRTIMSATDYFAVTNKLGEGGFGAVFKGQLQNGVEIAVKRLSRSSGQGTEEFKNEITLIARLQHRNLVKLLGCCIQQEERMLVYEYLPNKGLDNYIFDKEKRALLDWNKRFEIILGIARGMVYLHRDSRLKIIHRDLKSSNVLLDANMDPKISDFGMARIFGADQMEARTRRVVGTYGYMSPEYAMEGLFSEKSDVFSYGILLLEIISGKRSSSHYSENSLNLTGYVWRLWKEGKALDLVDPAIGESYNHDEVDKCIHIGLLCVQDQAKNRPTMSEVLSMLCNETSFTSASPRRPAFVIEKVNYQSDLHPHSTSTGKGASVNDVTITVIQGR